ncbi:hypothetical protein EMGBS4_03280 [Acidimicrobiaceae bacterium]|nr:hypothetical protein EMGBS4_03280 [Acidimicrobiaceae bacterium]
MGKLSTWWREEISLALNKYCAGAVLIDLLPQEHSAAFVPDEKLLGAYFKVDLATNQAPPADTTPKQPKVVWRAT